MFENGFAAASPYTGVVTTPFVDPWSNWIEPVRESIQESQQDAENQAATNAKLLEYLNQANDTPEGALDMLKELAKTDQKYAELYISLKAERENQERAYKWYEDFNNSYYQRTSKDLEAAGLNPWLALQSMGSSGTGSVASAGSFGSSGSTAAAQMEQQKSANGAKILVGVLAIAAMIIKAMI